MKFLYGALRCRRGVVITADGWRMQSASHLNAMAKAGAPPEMIYRHWGTPPPAWRPRFGSWRWRRVAAPAVTCRSVRCGEPRSARRDIRQRTENRGRGPRRSPATGGIMPWSQGVRERRRAACDDPPSLGDRAGLAPEIPVVVPASCGSACSRLSTVRCGEPRSTGRTVGGQEMTVAVPGERWNHPLVSRC